MPTQIKQTTEILRDFNGFPGDTTEIKTQIASNSSLAFPSVFFLGMKKITSKNISYLYLE